MLGRLGQFDGVVGNAIMLPLCCRRMFPPLRVRFSGLDDDDNANYSYDVMLDILPVNGHRYRYAYHRSSWVISDRVPADGTEAPSVAELMRSYRHPDGPFSASQLTQRAISFDRVKLTNNRTINKNGYVRTHMPPSDDCFLFSNLLMHVYSLVSLCKHINFPCSEKKSVFFDVTVTYDK